MHSEKIEFAKRLYLKYNGSHHIRIESEMRALGYQNFSRRSFYTRHKNGRKIEGWIDRFKWRTLLSVPPAMAGGVLKNSPTADRVVLYPQPINDAAADRGGNTTGWECVSTQQAETTNPPEPNPTIPQSFDEWLKSTPGAMQWDLPHQRIIYEKLNDITTGKTRRLMIFMPPRHGKSELVTVRYSAWRLLQDPSMNIILGSYNQKLANRFSRKIRNVLADTTRDAAHTGGNTTVRECVATQPKNNPASQVSGAGTLPHGRVSASNIPMFPLARRTNTVAEWETAAGGGLRAVGVGAGVTGYGAGLVIIDDPVKSRAQAESQTFRDRTWDWYNDDIYTRLEPDAPVILIQTRWHEDDLAGRLLREAANGGDQWEVVNLPAIAEGSGGVGEAMSGGETQTASVASPPLPRSPTPLLDKLARRPGDALWPERYGVAELERIQRQLGSYSFSALYQQRPSPLEGGLFKREWFKHCFVDRAPEGLKWCRGYDLAVSTKENADYTASFRVALDEKSGIIYIDGGFRKRIEFPEQRKYVIERMLEEKDTAHGIEKALHGQAFVQELQRDPALARVSLTPIKVETDKLTRALPLAARAEDGKVALVRGPWNNAFIQEACTFPFGHYDDQIDAVSIAVRMLSKKRSGTGGF